MWHEKITRIKSLSHSMSLSFDKTQNQEDDSKFGKVVAYMCPLKITKLLTEECHLG